MDYRRLRLIEILQRQGRSRREQDAIEKLADHLIGLGVTVQGWIPVEERLPERGQKIIVCSGDSVFAYSFWNKNYASWSNITHWQPMPEPPSKN